VCYDKEDPKGAREPCALRLIFDSSQKKAETQQVEVVLKNTVCFADAAVEHAGEGKKRGVHSAPSLCISNTQLLSLRSRTGCDPGA
jgi:hypothetical protein